MRTNKLLLIIISVLLTGVISSHAITPIQRKNKPYKPLKSAVINQHSLKDKGIYSSPQRASGDIEWETIHIENFNKCSKGSLSNPDSEVVQGEIPSSWTLAPNWNTSGAQQAGGAIYVGTPIDYDSTSYYILDTPIIGDAAAVFKIKFRVCAPTIADGETMDFFALHALNYGSSASMVDYEVFKLTNSWQDCEVTFSNGYTYSFIEFQSEKAPFAMDSFEIYKVADLEKPQILPATDIQEKSYTANWGAVKGADGYMLSPRVIHTADGMEPYYIINTDFSSVTEGTTSDPVYPTYAVESLDEYISQPGWLGRMVLKANGALGITNEYYSEYGSGLIQSPTVNLSAEQGKVKVKFRYLAQDVDMFQVTMYQVGADGSFTQRSSNMVYTNLEYNKWKEEEFTLGGGSTSSAIVIHLPYTTSGKIFFDELQISQVPEQGFRYVIPGATVTTSETSARVDTPDVVEGDDRAYTVQAYAIVAGTVLYSPESESIMVGSDSADVPENLAVPTNVITSTNGAAFTASWDPVPGANGYEVMVFRRHEALSDEYVTVMEEDFNKLKVGTTDLNYPRAMTQDGYDRLDDYTKVPGWEVYQGYYVDGAVGIWGYWNMLGMGTYMTSPNFDFSKDGGNMTLSVKIGSDNLQYPQGQGATIYLAHYDETGKMYYDDILPVDEFGYGWKNFTVNWKGGTENSFLVFFPYGYGLSYFDDIKITQRLEAGIYDNRVMSSITSTPSVSMVLPEVNTNDRYFIQVRAIWRDSYDNERVSSELSSENFLENLKPATHFSGVVQDPDGNGVANAVITLTSSNENSTPISAKANRWGLFQVDNIFETDATYIATATAPGYRTGVVSDLNFAGLNAVEDAVITVRPATDESIEIGLPTGYSANGALYLQYNCSDTETIYPADVLGIPAGSVIKEISFDGYCLTEKEISSTISITLDNTKDISYTEAAPGMGSDGELFWRGVLKLNAIGSKELPDEVLHFTNGTGFKYTGGSLRVALTSSATKNSQFYFLTDKRYKNASIYRYGSRSADSDWIMSKNGLPVMRILYTTPSGGTSSVAVVENDRTMHVTGGKGTITITSSEFTPVHIYDTFGKCIGIYNMEAGQSQTVNVAPGIYIVDGIKVMVK